MKKPLTPRSVIQRRAYTALLLTTALAACAQSLEIPTMKNYANHSFAFDARRYCTTEEVLAYRYGAGKGVGMSSDTAIRQFGRAPDADSVSGYIPVGETLYVKWRNKATREEFEDTVDLKPLLPADMNDKEIFFVTCGKQLTIYLKDQKQRQSATAPVVGPFKTQPYVTRQIYPRQ